MSHSLSFLKQHLRLGLLTAFLATFFVFASPSDAQAADFELHGGFGYMGLFNGPSSHGITVTLSPGLRWGWIGIYLDQNLGGVFHRHHHYSTSTFVGSTILNAKFFLDLGPAELWGQAGIGAAYIEDFGAFGLKLGAGVSVPLSSFMSLGLDLAYTLGANHGTFHLLALSGHIRLRF
ncbi:MAG: hypothetical protein FWC40_06930 [Proteobacteria bacterium]|nr:hypothetical protein [Pseudomonadota bacterium]